MKGISMTPQQFKFLKDGVKLAVGLGFTILLGTTYKVGKQTEEKLDDYFAKKYPQPDVTEKD